LPTFQLNAAVIISLHHFHLMKPEAFSQNIGKVFWPQILYLRTLFFV